MKFTELIEDDKFNLEEMLADARPFAELMMMYRCALREVTTKFEVLNEEFSLMNNRNPVESIKTRIKAPESIYEKMKRKGYVFTVESIRENIFDVAGVRIICSFPSDIFKLAEMLTRQDDIRVIAVKDYITNPKPNGYRSYHLIVEIPIFLANRTELMKVEVQFRTIAMDFWASLEHKLKYKKDIEDADRIAADLKDCAERISALDLKMQSIREEIDGEKQ
ncbi:MAG: GTP pyrophosphokinase family protein [Ruminiclostridium sp.]